MYSKDRHVIKVFSGFFLLFVDQRAVGSEHHVDLLGRVVPVVLPMEPHDSFGPLTSAVPLLAVGTVWEGVAARSEPECPAKIY